MWLIVSGVFALIAPTALQVIWLVAAVVFLLFGGIARRAVARAQAGGAAGPS